MLEQFILALRSGRAASFFEKNKSKFTKKELELLVRAFVHYDFEDYDYAYSLDVKENAWAFSDRLKARCLIDA